MFPLKNKFIAKTELAAKYGVHTQAYRGPTHVCKYCTEQGFLWKLVKESIN